jgi:hypothetical protein
MVAPALIAAARLALAAEKIYRRRDLLKPLGGEEDPRGIIEAARDPNVPVEDVRLRARLRSRTGRLVEKVEQELAAHPRTTGGPFEAIRSIFE